MSFLLFTHNIDNFIEYYYVFISQKFNPLYLTSLRRCVGSPNSVLWAWIWVVIH